MSPHGYSALLSTKIVRTVHKVCFREGFRAESLALYLASVPKRAVIKSVLSDDDTGDITIEFEEEEPTK